MHTDPRNAEWVSSFCHCWPAFVQSGMIEYVLCDSCHLPGPRWPLHSEASPVAATVSI